MKNLVFGLGAALCLLMPGESQAATCYGELCNNQGAAATGCADSAYTVGSTTFDDGVLQLKYSPECNTVYGVAYKNSGRQGTLVVGITTPTCPSNEDCNSAAARSTSGTYVQSGMWVPTGDASYIAGVFAFLEPYYLYAPLGGYNPGLVEWYR